jgi:hypothetical protein
MFGTNRCHSALGQRLHISQKYMNILTELAVKSDAGRITGIGIVAYLLKVRTMEPEKQPLLGNARTPQ